MDVNAIFAKGYRRRNLYIVAIVFYNERKGELGFQVEEVQIWIQGITNDVLL